MLYPRGAVLSILPTHSQGPPHHHLTYLQGPPVCSLLPGQCSKADPAQGGVGAAPSLPFHPTSSLPPSGHWNLRLGAGSQKSQSQGKVGQLIFKGASIQASSVILTPFSWLCGPSMCHTPGISFYGCQIHKRDLGSPS